MKCSEIVTHLFRYVPRVTDYFSEYKTPSAVTVSGDTVTMTLNSHGLINGQPVPITHAQVKNLITNISAVSDGITFTTQRMHNLTEGWYQSETVVLKSASNPAIDGTYSVTRVATNSTFTIPSFADTGLSDVYVYEYLDYGIDGLFNVTVIDENSFSYTLDYGEDIPGDYTLDVYPDSVRVHHAIRITGSNSIERFLKSYEKTRANELWMCVVLGNFTPSKSNRAQTDATNEQSGFATWCIPLIQPFSIYVVIPCFETSGRKARDLLEEVRQPIYKSIFGAEFSTGLDGPALSAVTPEADGEHIYNVAYYVHQLNFSQTARITNDDRLFSSRTTPFRTINIDFMAEDLDNDNVIMELSADLDN